MRMNQFRRKTDIVGHDGRSTVYTKITVRGRRAYDLETDFVKKGGPKRVVFKKI